jgi:hypothetical protein
MPQLVNLVLCWTGAEQYGYDAAHGHGLSGLLRRRCSSEPSCTDQGDDENSKGALGGDVAEAADETDDF